jgi:hypothetical protein
MRHTSNETSTTTLTYLKEEKDDNGRRTGHLVETVRTIEIYDVTVSNVGDILIKAMDRTTGESRSFRLDRIRSYTIHRTAYVIERPASDDKPARTTSLATVTVLYPIDCPATARVQLLADALAA